tara:strand:- start:499 stop:1257 length:759 start_codon:yes stop_codon:yes gene_type:complete
MRKKIIVGNWKMNLSKNEASDLVQDILNSPLDIAEDIEIVFAPSFLYLDKIVIMCKSFKEYSVAAQNCSSSNNGAFTGEISSTMLSSIDVKYVILGHSERRQYFGENSEELSKKIEKAFQQNLKVIFCCGESIEERNQSEHFNKISSQIESTLFKLSKDQFLNTIIAYEPIWSIGTGLTATPNQAQEMHAHIRTLISERYDEYTAQKISILYGGSCNPKNASSLFEQKDIDGGLIGGASLNSKDFKAIINSL